MMRARAHFVPAALPLALLLTALLALTGCGSDGTTDDGVASANGASREPASQDDHHQQLLAYAQCLRDHGLDVEDPAPGEGVQLQVEGDPAQAEPALQACADLAPPPPPDAPDKGEERKEMLAYAQCMRDNGVEKFADPKPGEGVHIGPQVAEDPDFKQAEEACDEMFAGGRGTNSYHKTSGSGA